MKSWWVRAAGGTTGLELRDVPEPQAGPGEIVLRVRASALNRGEFNARYHADGEAKPGGHEAAGVVVAVGEGVAGIGPGDRVMGRARGGFAELAAMHAHEAIPVPERLSWEQAAGVPLVFLITYEMLYRCGKLRSGEWLLVTAASSGVGVACLQTAGLIGARVIGTSRSAEKLARLRALGLAAGIDTRASDLAEQVRSITHGNGADVVVNNIGGSVFAVCLRALAFQGRLVTVSTLDDVTRCEIDISELHARRWELYGVSNRFMPVAKRAEMVHGFKRDLLPAIADGRISPVVDRVYPFDELPAAKRHMEASAQVGKIVVRMG